MTVQEYKEKIQDIKDSPDLTDAEKTKFIGKVEDLIKDLEKKETPKTVSIPNAKTVKPNRRLAQDQARNLPMVVRTPEHPKDKEVKANDLESEFAVKYVKSFLLMIGKKKLRKNLQSLLNAINKSADKKEIRAKSIHAEAINYVAQSLVAALNTDYATFVFKLDKVGSEVLEPYMNAKEALPNRLLRSFYTSQNKKFAKTHANLLKRLEKVEDKNNPFASEISEAIKVLKKAQQNNSTIQATKPTLRGLAGIMNGLSGKSNAKILEKIEYLEVRLEESQTYLDQLLDTYLKLNQADKQLYNEELNRTQNSIEAMKKRIKELKSQL